MMVSMYGVFGIWLTQDGMKLKKMYNSQSYLCFCNCCDKSTLLFHGLICTVFVSYKFFSPLDQFAHVNAKILSGQNHHSFKQSTGLAPVN